MKVIVKLSGHYIKKTDEKTVHLEFVLLTQQQKLKIAAVGDGGSTCPVRDR